MHFFIFPIFLPILLMVVLIRLVTAPLRWGRRYHRHYGSGWGGYGDGAYGYGCGRRRYGMGSGLFTVLGLLALERLFGRRW